MKTVFADTGYWQAITDPHDQLHDTALAISRSLRQTRIVTTEMVLAELLNALSKIPVREVAAKMVELIRSNPNVEVIPQTGQQFRDALELYRTRADKAWSLTDCASFKLMESRAISEALAYDRHFEQAGFQALLRTSAH
ncbi:MAG: type II toxin-antitoxin system VapC family toxin [Candidatus Methylumidiphilus sp.]